MASEDRRNADPDLISEGEADGMAWEVRTCGDVVTVEVMHWSQGIVYPQAISVSAAAADAIGPALVLAAKRLRLQAEEATA